MGEEAVVLDPDTGQLHYLNPQAALVLALIEEEGYERALGTLKERFPDVPTIEADVAHLVSDMTEKGILLDG